MCTGGRGKENGQASVEPHSKSLRNSAEKIIEGPSSVPVSISKFHSATEFVFLATVPGSEAEEEEKIKEEAKVGKVARTSSP